MPTGVIIRHAVGLAWGSAILAHIPYLQGFIRRFRMISYFICRFLIVHCLMCRFPLFCARYAKWGVGQAGLTWLDTTSRRDIASTNSPLPISELAKKPMPFSEGTDTEFLSRRIPGSKAVYFLAWRAECHDSPADSPSSMARRVASPVACAESAEQQALDCPRCI